MSFPPRYFHLSLNLIVGEVYHNIVLENVYILSISCEYIYQKFPTGISTLVWNQICRYSLVVSQYPIICTVLEGIKFPCRHTLFQVMPHFSVLAKLWVLFPYISYVNLHSSRILIARILNKTLRNLLPLFNDGQGPTRLFFYLL